MRCVLLDLDGTLTDSRPGILASIAAALRALGHEPDRSADLSRVVGPPLDEMLAEVLRHYGDLRVAEAMAAYRAHYVAVGLFDNAVYPGVAALLAAARFAQRRLYLATSKPEVVARRILSQFALAQSFDGIYGAVPSGALDRKPALIAHILEREAISPAEAVMVGDRHHDIQAAHANGLRAIGVLWGYGGRDELVQAGADWLVDSPAHLGETLGLRARQSV